MVQRAVVPAPPPAPRPINLRTSARLVDDGARWQSGITLLPEMCAPGKSEDPCAGPDDVKDPGEPMDLVSWDPYTIYTYETCGYTLNEDAYADLAARARRSLEAQTSHLVEDILWTNYVDNSDFGATHPNISLQSGTIVGIPAPPVTAMQQMDELLSTDLGGRRGMIHVAVGLIHHLAFYGLIQQEGNLWVTKTGNIVVPGTGYTGNLASGTVDGISYMFGTSMVELRLSEIVVLPGDIASAVDRETNQIVVRAERLALAYWDLCAHIGIPVCTTDPGPDCGPVS